MLENLIVAYRAQFYDWKKGTLKKIEEENKILFYSAIVIIVLVICLPFVCFWLHQSWFAYLVILIEIIFGIWSDSYFTKRAPKFISAKSIRLEEIILFLKTTIPNRNLYNEEQINALINRLTEYIETHPPFHKFKTTLSTFSKTIILPIVTFIAGLYSSSLSKDDFVVAIGWGLVAIIILAGIYILWNFSEPILRGIAHRNYNAAIEFKENLLDLKLLYFTKDKE